MFITSGSQRVVTVFMQKYIFLSLKKQIEGQECDSLWPCTQILFSVPHSLLRGVGWRQSWYRLYLPLPMTRQRTLFIIHYKALMNLLYLIYFFECMLLKINNNK